VAIGNALGQRGTPQATEGTVTALNQTITVQGDITPGETLKGLVEFNAPIQSGDSGGPLVDAQGRVVGMDTAAAFGGGGFRSRLAPSDAGFAIPINTALPIAQRISAGKAGGNIHVGPRPLIGVEVSDAGGSGSGGGFGDFGGFGSQTPSAPVSSGALVEGVSSGTPAASIGLTPGDVIVSLGGQTISDSAGLSAAILQHKVGDTVSVGWVDQSGNHHSSEATLVAGPPA
jgi:S1-C subfamily serine protease